MKTGVRIFIPLDLTDLARVNYAAGAVKDLRDRLGDAVGRTVEVAVEGSTEILGDEIVGALAAFAAGSVGSPADRAGAVEVLRYIEPDVAEMAKRRIAWAVAALPKVRAALAEPAAAPAETKPSTMAERVAGFFPKSFRSPAGDLDDVCRALNATVDYGRRNRATGIVEAISRGEVTSGDLVRYGFADGSAIVEAGDAWDIEGATRWSWQ